MIKGRSIWSNIGVIVVLTSHVNVIVITFLRRLNSPFMDDKIAKLNVKTKIQICRGLNFCFVHKW